MKFYKQQHEYYCGIDLHANSMHVCARLASLTFCGSCEEWLENDGEFSGPEAGDKFL
jgi:hypothetical protein